MADLFREDPGAFLRELFAVAVKAAQAEDHLKAHLPDRPKGRLIVLGAGKAAAAMAAVAEQHYGPDVEGVVVVPDGYARACRYIDVMEASHPVPDERGVEAARRILSMADDAQADDLVLCLLSGGASAVMALPAPGVSLEDKRGMTNTLLRSGATIGEINCVRKHLSAMKGGRLAEAAAPARVVCLVISDVAGDDPGVIGSGPTVPDSSTCDEALAVLRKYAVNVPAGVEALLAKGELETPKHSSANVSVKVVMCARDALASASAYARRVGLQAIDLGGDCEGEARTFAQEQAALVKRICAGVSAPRPPCLIISGGELTVRVDGAGRGGPNTEFALALALALNGLDSVWAIAADTDGRDGSAGAAGAVVGPDTLQRLRARGFNAVKALECNDSGSVFAALGDLVDPGPTFTNINDFRAILVLPKGHNGD